MKTNQTHLVRSLGMAAVSVFLGAYLAAGTDFLAAQVVMLSLPPASLWIAVRRHDGTETSARSHPVSLVGTTWSEPEQSVEHDLDRLVRAS